MIPGENILQAQTDVHVAVPSYNLLDHADEGGHVAVPSYSLLDHADEIGRVKLTGWDPIASNAFQCCCVPFFLSASCLLGFVFVLFVFFFALI